MPKRALIVAFLISASSAFGQLDSNSITVTASRSTTLQPDQVVFSVDVASGLDASLDDIITALASSGISAANFLRVSTVSRVTPINTIAPTTSSVQLSLEWSFTLPVSWSNMKDTIATLTALQKSIPQKNSTLAVLFGVQGTRVSPQLQQTQTCSLPDLLSDARAQAQKLASAANLFLGAVLAMSSFTSMDTGSNTAVPYYAFSLPCSVTVKFAVTR